MYRLMDETEIEIRQMKDLRMVHFYNLAGDKIDAGEGVLSVAVYYGGNGQLNLSILDKYFDLLVERVFAIYANLEDKSAIIADENTRNILDLGSLNFDNYAWTKYLTKEGQFEPRYLSISYHKGILLPLVDYYLKQLYQLFNMNYKSHAFHFGWRQRCVIEGFVNDEIIKFPLVVELLDDKNYRVCVYNFMKNGVILEIHISYGLDTIHVNYSCDYWNIIGDSQYYFENNRLIDTSMVKNNGKVVYYDTTECELIANPADKFEDLRGFIGAIKDDMQCFRLPWGEIFMTRTSGIETKDYLYMLLDTNMGILHNATEDGRGLCLLRGWSWRQITNSKDNLIVKTLAMAFDRLLTKTGEVQTHFLDAGSCSYGLYKEKVQNRYYYECLEDSIWEF